MKPYQIKNERIKENDVDDLFIDRWSPRSLSRDMSEKEMMTLFEAARWSPSSSNSQPWRFLYSKNEDENWERYYNLLGEFNKIWCKNAAFLIVLLSRKNFELEEGEKEEGYDRNHSLGAGMAFMSLALQARMKNFIVHGMAGFDVEKTRKELEIPEGYEIECMIAVGKQGEIEESIPERMQKSEKPSQRKELNEIISKGKFNEDWN